ncbi:MAG: 50S ribosomal protein L2 [Chitinispirillia bacterium]|nr:50S ribosomal protein L2 [Chitinispirillia bacterium]MCL2241016.1 50S ribosomal protein L2 [Chitinispirillia bacterium]
MALKQYRPMTPTLRYKTTTVFDQITTDTPHKPLLVSKHSTGGRNNRGVITVRHRGGGHKRFIRIIDFKRDKFNVPGVVETIEYDPNRSAFIALVKYMDGDRRYILATVNMKIGQKIMSGDKAEIAEGNCMLLANIPLGTQIHNIELREKKGGQIARSAGAYAEVVAKENKMVQLKFPSSEVRNVRETCIATIGQVSNHDHMNISIGSAGRKRHMGVRPTVRGVAMNPVDHPMGGGEGKTSGGGHPVSPWGQKAKGLKTRNRKKPSSKYIVKRRTKK